MADFGGDGIKLRGLAGKRLEEQQKKDLEDFLKEFNDPLIVSVFSLSQCPLILCCKFEYVPTYSGQKHSFFSDGIIETNILIPTT